MKKWTALVSLFALFIGIQTYAQDNVIELQFERLISSIQPQKSIIERTASFENHSRLLNALRATNLDKVLNYKGEFTVSASTILRAMCRGNGVAKFTTIQGEKITATMKGIDIVLTDKSGNSAVIVTADSNQSNGIIHEIDTVFVPETTF